MQDMAEVGKQVEEDQIGDFVIHVACVAGGAIGMGVMLVTAVLVFAVDPLVVTGGFIAGLAWAVIMRVVADGLRRHWVTRMDT